MECRFWRIRQGSFGVVVCIGIMLFLARLPFYFTRHIQEDAYIYFRFAVNLAKSGVFCFNPLEKVSGVTSYLYLFLLAFLRYICKGYFIGAATVVNTIIILVAGYLVSSVLTAGGNRRLLLWAIISLTPISLRMGYLNMDTALFVLVISLILYGMFCNKASLVTCIGLFLLPWARPEAVVVGIIFVAAEWLRKKNLPRAMLAWFLLGTVSMFCFNRLYFGSWLHQSIIGKMVTYAPSHKLIAVWHRIGLVFWERFMCGGAFVPVESKYTAVFGPFFFMFTVAAFIYIFFVYRKQRELLFLMGILAAIVFLLPVGYAIGGVIFPWYLWPSAFFAMCAMMTIAVRWIKEAPRGLKPVFAAILILMLLAGAAFQWAISFSWGTQERLWRAGIGEHIKKISNVSDSIMLEPFGYIPYFAERYTHDENGIISPESLLYRLRYGSSWWISYIRDKKPTFLVERFKDLDSPYNLNKLSAAEREWFYKHYELIRAFVYCPEEFYQGFLLRAILKRGSAVNWYLFKRKDA